MPTSIETPIETFDETPRGAIEEIRAAINSRDYARLQTRIDLKKFVDLGYDDAIDRLALNCEEFHRKYPHDLLFQFGPKALRAYNMLFRSIHLKVIFSIIESYFKTEPTLPKKFSEDPIAYCAFHFKRLVEDVRGEVVETNGNLITVDMSSRLIGTLRFKFETASVDGRRKVIRIANAEELVRPIVDIAERVWPREWDRGISL